jgi:hypothetical protein
MWRWTNGQHTGEMVHCWGPSDWIHNGMPGSCMLTIRSSSHRNLILHWLVVSPRHDGRSPALRYVSRPSYSPIVCLTHSEMGHCWGPSDWIHNGMPGSCMLTIRSSSHRNLIRRPDTTDDRQTLASAVAWGWIGKTGPWGWQSWRW